MSLFKFGKNKVSNMGTGTSFNVGNTIDSTASNDICVGSVSSAKVTLTKAEAGL